MFAGVKSNVRLLGTATLLSGMSSAMDGRSDTAVQASSWSVLKQSLRLTAVLLIVKKIWTKALDCKRRTRSCNYFGVQPLVPKA